jgi:hypothetical protein
MCISCYLGDCARGARGFYWSVDFSSPQTPVACSPLSPEPLACSYFGGHVHSRATRSGCHSGVVARCSCNPAVPPLAPSTTQCHATHNAVSYRLYQRRRRVGAVRAALRRASTRERSRARREILSGRSAAARRAACCMSCASGARDPLHGGGYDLDDPKRGERAQWHLWGSQQQRRPSRAWGARCQTTVVVLCFQRQEIRIE